MKLNTTIEKKEFPFQLDHQSRIILVGSCFAENMGNKLRDAKFSVQINPLGISYNPLSLFQLMSRSLNDNLFEVSEIHYHRERYFSFDLHSVFSSMKKAQLLENANEKLLQQKQWISSANCLFISLGTAWVYLEQKSGKLVNNCHKLPAQNFEKKRLEVEEILLHWEALAALLMKFNPKLQIVFTLSPVRHLKNGSHANQISKATLLLAIEEICNAYPHCHYFPSYELMMDELRDYRFYDRDLVHPSPIAIELIWEYFQKCLLSPETISTVKKIRKIMSAFEHKPFEPKSNSHLQFLQKLKEKMVSLQNETSIDLKNEIASISEQIKS